MARLQSNKLIYANPYTKKLSTGYSVAVRLCLCLSNSNCAALFCYCLFSIYSIYPKYSDTPTPYHTCSKI